MKKIAVYPGSFDPITNGHLDIIHRISNHFDQIIILIASSSQKNSLFTPEERKKLIQEAIRSSKIKVDLFDGLTVDYMKKAKAQVIVRGLRAVMDFEYEMTLASMNKRLSPNIETMLVFASPELYYVSSRGVKEIATNKGSLEGLVPPHVEKALKERLKHVVKKSAKS